MNRSTRRIHASPLAALQARAIAARAFLVLAFVAAVGLGCRAQNSNDAPTGMPNAAFAASATQGPPGLTVNFVDQSSGDFDTLLWDFDNGTTSNTANPSANFPNAGTYDVSLTVSGARGSDTMVTTIEVADAPVAGFDCTPDSGFAPLVTTCNSSATSATTISWEVSTAGAGVVATASGSSPVFNLTTADTYTVTQTVSNAVGSDTATDTVEVWDIVITSSVPSGSPPGDVLFIANTAAPVGEILTWMIDGFPAGGGLGFVASLNTPGTYTIDFMYANSSPPLLAGASIQHVVGYGPPTAAFSQSETEGAGPLDVTFTDESTGTIHSWAWDFGDGDTCVFPAESPPGATATCSGASPTHTYGAVGRYDVTLTVTGEDVDPSDPDLVDATTVVDAVSVTIVDPSFEEQGVAAGIGGAWTAITPPAATATADHTALSDAQAEGADAGMPTDGQKWAALDGLGTDGSDPALLVENGVRQSFLRPAAASVLEFDFVLLYAEPPAGAVMDAMTATVSDGSTTVEITSARADVSSPYAGPSARYPTLDGGTTRATPVHTASLDLAAAFPGAGPDTIYTLTIRLTNDVNGFRSPRAYVDHVRFTQPAASFTTAFSVPAVVVTGEPVDFMDETCPDPVTPPCVEPTSWRWDFDTQLATTPPAASGSGDQDPVYTFAEAGDYDVRLLARNADQESLAQLTVSVLAAPVSIPAVQSATGTTAPATITFEDQSTFDASDPIVAWSWDFAGWGTSTAQNPAPVEIGQAGTWTIRLTITTASGRTDTASLDVVLD